MKRLKIQKKDLSSWIEHILKDFDVYAPARLSDGVSSYRRIETFEMADLRAFNSRKPLKEVFFPQSESMFKFERSGKSTRLASAAGIKRQRIVFGARPCDIRALATLDEVFLGGDFVDVYYEEKRKATTVVGLACIDPHSTCFCTSTGGSPFCREGSDLFLIDLGEHYLVEVLTEKGERIAEIDFFSKPEGKEIELANDAGEMATKKTDGQVPLDGIEHRLDSIVEDPVWDTIHEKCIGCGVCTYLCPTCHCFDIVDEVRGQKGRRTRNWDSCLYPHYSLQASGHNPRPTGRERTRQRLMHKFNYFPKNFKKIACVGCGRCILYCPVNFDIRQAIRDLRQRGNGSR